MCCSQALTAMPRLRHSPTPSRLARSENSLALHDRRAVRWPLTRSADEPSRPRYRGNYMVTRWPEAALLGRRHECDVLDRLLVAAGGGQSGVLVLVGEPGIGKTALLGYAIESASSFRVARATGVEWEM